ncbi:MAG: anaerobic carbon-monoxide dehydrogenase catalytic subunit [Chitinivibrionales bacterium]|nr:anaerobic carbon-monoxide dehydrogenase catalytic subunit [Chitinivibrionales bacterium]
MKNTRCNASLIMRKKAKKDEIPTVWDRYEEQTPQCSYGLLGVCCHICNMGPCRIDPFGNAPQKGVCGATADSMVARNFLAHIATGAAAHSDHSREIVLYLRKLCENTAENIRIADKEKLRMIAEETGIDQDGKTDQAICFELAQLFLREFGKQLPGKYPLISRVPKRRLELWQKLNVVPRGIDREIVDSMHRTHIGVDNDCISILTQGIRTALADGWVGSMIATEMSDLMFGVPKPKETQVNLGVLQSNMVNIIIHGHDPLMSESLIRMSNETSMLRRAQENGAEGINVCGMCCTGNEMLMRHGIKLAGNFLQQELAIITGAVEAMIVDIQCIMPSLGDIAKCYHTKFITTSSKANFPGAVAMEFNDRNADETAYNIVQAAVDNYRNRKMSAVCIPKESMNAIVGFSGEALRDFFGNGYEQLIESLKTGQIKGIAAVVGCNNPKTEHDSNHIAIVRQLLDNDILVVTTGCGAIACAKSGLLTTNEGPHSHGTLSRLCNQLRIPPVLHMGSCVDNSRILVIAAKLANALNCDISDLPLAATAPEWMSQKAISIGTYTVGSGIFTVLGTVPRVLGSPSVKSILTQDIESILGARFAVEPDPIQAASLIISHIENKRKTLFTP